MPDRPANSFLGLFNPKTATVWRALNRHRPGWKSLSRDRNSFTIDLEEETKNRARFVAESLP
jgi:hypothetical protein